MTSTALDRYPGKMVSGLADRLVRQYTGRGDSVLDPFCGSGAILASAASTGLRTAGIDLNPLAELFSQVKTGGFDSAIATTLAQQWIAEARDVSRPLRIEWSGKHYWFTRGTLNKYERLRRAANVLAGGGAERRAVLLSYVLSVRLCSRADQRSPKPFISQEARRTRANRHFDPYKTLLSVLAGLSARYGGRARGSGTCEFLQADVRRLQVDATHLGTYSHVITSPPYINAQDYFRNFKLELYLSEDLMPFNVASLKESFIGTERGNLLQHVPRESIERDLAVAPDLERIKSKSPRLGSVVHRYFHDMESAFAAACGLLSESGCLVVVCGDNLVGGVRVCTWRVLQAILESRGYRLVDRFRDPIRNRMLAPRRLGHRGLIKEEVVSAYRTG